jgi:hypothetical protein
MENHPGDMYPDLRFPAGGTGLQHQPSKGLSFGGSCLGLALG